MNNVPQRIYAVFFIPILFLFSCLQLKSAAGPYYLGNNLDPSYLYLVNSLYILNGLPPDFIQHPGTTLQLWGALVIRCVAGPIPFGQLVENVYRNPEVFLNAIYYSILAVNIGSLIALGWYLLLKLRRVVWVIVVQGSVLLIAVWNASGVAQGDIPVVANVNAENFFIGITNIYSLLLLKLYFDRKDGKIKFSGHRLAALFGFIGGIGIVTKTLFLGWAIAPFFLIKDWKGRVIFVLTLLLNIGLWTMPIWPNLKHMVSWYTTALTHSGNHGAGAFSIFDFGNFYNNFSRIITENLFYFGICLMIVGKLLVSFLNRNKQSSKETKDSLAVEFVCVMLAVVFFTMLVIARQHASHYMVPTVNFLGLLCFFAGQIWPVKEFFLGAILVVFTVFNMTFVSTTATKLSRMSTENYNFFKKVYSDYKDAIVCGFYRSSSPAFAMQFGDENQGRLAYVDVLQKVYPNTVFFHYWNRYFYDGRDVINYVDLKEHFPRILLYGSHLPESFNKKYIKVREIAASSSEGLYEVERVTIEEALTAFSLSKDFEAHQQYVQAYALAQEAKALGMINIDPYMESLLKKIIQTP